MIEIQDYIELKGYSRRHVNRLISQGKLIKTREGDKEYVLEPGMVTGEKSKQKLIEEMKKEFALMILQAHNDKSLIEKIITEIQNKVMIWKERGVEIKGFSASQIYRKINEPERLKRKTRADKFSIKNKILSSAEAYQKMLGLAWKFYKEDSNGSIRLAVQRIQMYAKEKEEFYELAAVPFTTLYDNVKKAIKQNALDKNHQLINHFNEFRKRQIYNKGAFIDDIGFMDWYAMDDHVMEVAGTQVYNSVKGKWEMKKVYLWTIIECKTLFPIAYQIMPENFMSEDIKQLMLQALMNMGRPKKGILMDNGLASSKRCIEFLTKLKINADPGEAYEPLHKAVQERIFGFIKNEFASNFKNSIGGKREEVRHSGKALSPEKCDHIESEFIKKFDAYMEGFYQTKIRDREINGSIVKINIRDFFNNEWVNYKVDECSGKELRNAYMEGVEKKMDWNYINFAGNVYVCDEVLHPVLNNRKYHIKFNPLDKNEIDLYATEDILIQNTGEFIERGSFVATLRSQRNMGSEERQKIVAKVRKGYQKAVRKASEAVTDMIVAKDISAFSDELNKKGQIIYNRKETLKVVKDLLEDESNKILKLSNDDLMKKNIISDEVKEESFEEMTQDELDELNELIKNER